MNLIKRLISCAVAFACVSVPMNSIISVDNNINAVEEITESPIWDGTADISWYDDDETEFHLSTAEELAGLSELSRVGKTMEGKTIYLDNDVILNDTSDFENWTKNLKLLNNWTSISNFKGTFEGQGHNISGIYCESFFTYISDGKINSVNFTESYVYKSINTNTLHDYKYYTDYNYCGGICNKIDLLGN